ncbi:MAG: c-type cytochrome [Leadbetterella sp.]|nr:c-type cytochrome [Leadbetterella sp.]
MSGQGVFAQETAAEAAGDAGSGDPVAGETLFKNNCKQCHSAEDKIVVGPGLKGIEERRDLHGSKPGSKTPTK